MLDERSDERALADTGGAREPDDAGLAGLGIDLAHELPAGGIVALDEGDAARERPLVAREQALRERAMRARRSRLGFHCGAYHGSPVTRDPTGMAATIRFWARNRMITPKYARLVLRLIRR